MLEAWLRESRVRLPVLIVLETWLVEQRGERPQKLFDKFS